MFVVHVGKPACPTVALAKVEGFRDVQSQVPKPSTIRCMATPQSNSVHGDAILRQAQDFIEEMINK